MESSAFHGILPVNKPAGKTSFSLIAVLRRHLGVKRIGHAGTLDPFATGVMVILIGREYTRLSDQFLGAEKEYIARLHLGIDTDSYDCDGQILARSDVHPSEATIREALLSFQGTILQTPPMYSAKKVGGRKLYELARRGQTIDRQAVPVQVETEFLQYHYPYLDLKVKCSKGTYIRSIAHDLGRQLGCGAHLSLLQRKRSGSFHLDQCIDGAQLFLPGLDLEMLKSNLILEVICKNY